MQGGPVTALVNNAAYAIPGAVEDGSESPGRRLREARTAARLSQDDVAVRLRLDRRVVDALERDDHRSLPEPTFVRGYLRSYARLLGLPAGPIVEAYDREGHTPPGLVADLSRRQEVRSSDPPVRLMTYVVVAALVTLGVLWWRYERTPEPVPLDQAAGFEAVAHHGDERGVAAPLLGQVAGDMHHLPGGMIFDREQQRGGGTAAAYVLRELGVMPCSSVKQVNAALQEEGLAFAPVALLSYAPYSATTPMYRNSRTRRTKIEAISTTVLFLPYAVMIGMYFISGLLAVTSFNIRMSATQAYLPAETIAQPNGAELRYLVGTGVSAAAASAGSISVVFSMTVGPSWSTIWAIHPKKC